jgi:pimeloyl-ACP methyl ester carboxylesterase
MRPLVLLWLLKAAGFTPALAVAQSPDRWRDPAPHRAGFVSVARGVRLHYLDWGGTGPPLIFLAGLGNTAHAWDTFAPRFTDRFHVVAITRRGFGESSHPPGGYDLRTRVDDIRRVLDSLHLQRVSLAGHSIAGEELTRFAIAYPDRVDKLVYLEAAYDRVMLDKMIGDALPIALDLPRRPPLTGRDTLPPSAYVAYVQRTRGVDIPEADIRARLAFDGAEESLTTEYQAVGSAVERPDYLRIRAPALAVFAITDSVDQTDPWIRADTARRAGEQFLLDRLAPIYRAARDQFRRSARGGRVLEVRGGHHWIFLSHADQVARAMRDFLLSP